MEGGRIFVLDAAGIQEGHARKIRFTFTTTGHTQELVLCRFEGRLYALDSLCPHEGGRLAAGPLMRGRYAYCPLHLFKFDPRDGRSVGIDSASAAVYPVDEANGKAVIRVHEISASQL